MIFLMAALFLECRGEVQGLTLPPSNSRPPPCIYFLIPITSALIFLSIGIAPALVQPLFFLSPLLQLLSIPHRFIFICLCLIVENIVVFFCCYINTQSLFFIPQIGVVLYRVVLWISWKKNNWFDDTHSSDFLY